MEQIPAEMYDTLTFEEYAARAETTAIYRDQIEHPNDRIDYVILGLIGEAGELANRWKKFHRGDKSRQEVINELFGEGGDVLWYLAQLCNELDINMNDMAAYNLAKLRERMEKGKIRGDGEVR